MENQTQTQNSAQMVWLDADVALRAYEDSITQKEYQDDATNGWTARMNLVNQLIESDKLGKIQRREARLAKEALKKPAEAEVEMGA